MLKQKLTSAPGDDLKGAYVQKGDEWFLDALADDHPKILENKTLIEEKRKAEAELDSMKANVGNIERERDEAKTKSLPAGHRAVSVADADLINAIKPLNLTKEAIASMATENEQFKAERAVNESKAVKSKALKLAGVTDEETFFGMKQADTLDFEFETIDGKEKAFAVKEENGAKVKAEFNRDYLSKADGFKNIIPVLFNEQEKKGFQFSDGARDTSGKNEFDLERERVRAEQKAKAPTDNASVLAALGGMPVAATN